MYPISSRRSDEEEATGFGEYFYLPRNLSYVEESYLDNLSVSSNFVHTNSKNKQFRYAASSREAVTSSEMSEIPRSADQRATETDSCSDATSHRNLDNHHEPGCDLNIDIKGKTGDRVLKYSDGGSDTSEEGIFVNMDDLDNESAVSRSNGSEDLSIDSINTPDENDLAKSTEGRIAKGGSLEDALSQAVETMAVSCPVSSAGPEEDNPSFTPLKLKINDRYVNTDKLSDFGSERSFLELYMTEDDSPTYQDKEFNFERGELRKSSSLKTNKTPPGTPRRKKMVRFADAMGLDLEDVRHVLNLDAPPKIPASAMADLKVGVEEDRKHIGSRYFTACFSQPGSREDFLQVVMAQKVCLENAVITDLTVTGVVRVANIGFHKSVRIRYSTNSWISFHDIMASYVQNSCDGPTDRFSFSICAPANFNTHSKLEFAISYSVNENMYWDSNHGQNYVLECFAKTTPTDVESSWVHFL